MATLNRFL